MTKQDVSARFAREAADHEMTVLHDDGLYRHLRFKAPQTSMYWFDLITVPGSLIFRGDGESFVFARVQDMFEFFRGQRINPVYWSEKLTSNRDVAKRYDPDLFRAYVTETFVERARFEGVPAGTGAALRREVLEYADYEHEARDALQAFDYRGFRFWDVWDVSFHDYDWWFLWSLHAIVWGIAQYDAHRAGEPMPRAAIEQLGDAATGRQPVLRTATTVGGVL